MTSFSMKKLIILICFFTFIKSKLIIEQYPNFNYTVLAGQQNQTISGWIRNNILLTIGMCIGVLIIIILLICIITCSIVLRNKYKNFYSKIHNVSYSSERNESRDSSDILA